VGENNIPFAIRLRSDLRITTEEGCELTLQARLHWRERGKHGTGWLGAAKNRGLNLEDTRLTDPHKLDLLIGLVALAWAGRVLPAHSSALTGQSARPMATSQSHGSEPDSTRSETSSDQTQSKPSNHGLYQLPLTLTHFGGSQGA